MASTKIAPSETERSESVGSHEGNVRTPVLDPDVEKKLGLIIKADQLWITGDDEGASANYYEFRNANLTGWGRMPVYSDEEKRAFGPHMLKYFSRMVEHCVMVYQRDPKRYRGTLKTAQEFVDSAVENGIALSPELVQSIQEAKNYKPEEKSYKVGKGAFRGSISIEITEDYDVGLDLKDFSLDDAGVLEFTAVWHPERNGAPMRSWAAYDSEGVKISDGTLSFGDHIRGGEPTRGRMLVGHDKWKATTKIRIE